MMLEPRHQYEEKKKKTPGSLPHITQQLKVNHKPKCRS